MGVAASVPIEEYLSTSWDPDREYVDGRLVERNVGKLDHSYLVGQLAMMLDRCGLRPFISVRAQVKPKRFRVPDVAALREKPSGRFLRRPPYVVVEVLSSDDRVSDFEEKFADYLEFGVENVWVVDPQRRWVLAYGAVICRDRVQTRDPTISISLEDLFGDMPVIE
jgi:Uma2 family endonuclease